MFVFGILTTCEIKQLKVSLFSYLLCILCLLVYSIVFAVGYRYVVVYFSILYFRYHAGIVTDEMLAFPKLRFVVISALGTLRVASGMAATAI